MESDWYPDTYFAYIRSPEWRRVVARYFKSHPCRCAACGSEVDIHLHHKTYTRLEAQHDSDLAPLCRQCHSTVHGIQQLSAGDLDQVTELWIESFRTQPTAEARQRAILKRTAVGQRTARSRSVPERDNVVHVGMFSYVVRRGSSFVTWSTFWRRAKAVWMSSTLERAALVCESIDRRAQALLAESAPTPKAMSRPYASNGAPAPQSRSEERRVGKECRSRWS